MRQVGRVPWTTLAAALVLAAGVAAADRRQAAGAPAAQPAAGLPTRYQRHVGRDAPVGGELGGIVSLAFGSDDTVYAVDAAAVRVLRIDAEGRLIGAWGSVGHGPGEFGQACLAFDMRDQRRPFLGNWLNGRWKGPSCAGGVLIGPSDVAVGPAGDVYVADPMNGRVQRFTPWGAFVGSTCVFGRDAAQPAGCAPTVAVPGWSVAVAGDGTLFVATPERGMVRVLAPDGTSRDAWPIEASDLAIDAAGRIWVGEPTQRRLRVLSPAGTILAEIGPLDACNPLYGGPMGGFSGPEWCNPLALAIDPDGHAVVGMQRDFKPAIERVEASGWRGDVVGEARLASAPPAVAVARDGTIVAAQVQFEGGHERTYLAVFASDGRPLARWDVLGGDLGALNHPVDVAWLADGGALVLDGRSGRVQRLDAGGEVVGGWGGPGRSGNRLAGPSALAIAPDGDVVVADTGNLRVQRFDAGGEWRSTVGGPAPADGGLERPIDAVVLAGGDVLVADAGAPRAAPRIVRYGPDGRWRDAWPVPPPPGDMTAAALVALAVAPDGRIALLDAAHRRVLWLAPDGGSVIDTPAVVGPEPPVTGSRPWPLEPSAAAFAADGALLVALADGGILRLPLEGDPRWAAPAGCGDGAVVGARGLAAAPDGRVLVADLKGRRVVELGPDGAAGAGRAYAPPSARRDAAFDRPAAVAAAGDAVVVADTGHDRLLSLAPHGGASVSVSAPGCGERSLGTPLAVAAAPGGAVVAVADGRVRFVGADGGLGRVWGGGGALGSPGGVAVVPAAAPGEGPDVVAADMRSGGIVRWAWDGSAKGGWTDGPSGVALSSPHQIAVAPDRTLWVADTGNHRLAHFTLDGVPLGRIGGAAGAGPGQLDAPEGVAVLPDGTVVAADTGNRRLQAFAADGTWLGAWHGDGPPGTALRRPAGLSVTADGTLWVADREADRAVAFGPTAGSDWHLQLDQAVWLPFAGRPAASSR